MTFFERNALALLMGFIMDCLIGDPEGWPHPVIWIGKYISFAQKRLRARGGNLRAAAIALTVSTVLIAMVTAGLVLFLLSLMGDIALVVGMSVIAWSTLSIKCLAKEGRGVARALAVSLEEGRKRVARIVGRDTSGLSQEEIVKATVETVAENTTDGVISVMLYLLIGGPVLAMGFKAASTLDSMVGYLDDTYRDIGWSSAKLDDALNFIPARLCGLLMCVSAFLCGMDGKNALRVMRRDHANHLSPNCAWPESAAAGALRIQLGGTHSYFGKAVEKPIIGDGERRVEIADISRANRLLFASSILMLALMLIAGGAL